MAMREPFDVLVLRDGAGFCDFGVVLQGAEGVAF